MAEPPDPRRTDRPPDLPADPAGSITMMFGRWREGDPPAFDALILRFRARLLGLAGSKLAGRPQRVGDAEDAVQSAVVSFWEKAGRGDLPGDLDRNDLWNLLGVMTVRKALRQQTRERAQKRGGGRAAAGDVADAAAGPAPESADLLWAELLELLGDDLRVFAALRLLGHTNAEIAGRLDCTERKVERKLNLIRAIWRPEVEKWSA